MFSRFFARYFLSFAVARMGIPIRATASFAAATIPVSRPLTVNANRHSGISGRFPEYSTQYEV
jgi:hypothetical protein